MSDLALYVQTFTISVDGLRLAAGAPRLEGVRPEDQRALLAEDRPFLRLGMRRIAHVVRHHGRGGEPVPIARLYLSAAGQLDPQWVDTYFLTRIARGEPVVAVWDGRGRMDEVRARARYDHTPADAMLGVCRLINLIEAITAVQVDAAAAPVREARSAQRR